MSLETIDTKPRRTLSDEERGFGRASRMVQSVVLLILNEGRSYGYEVRRRLRELGYDGAESDPGALYRLLRELEATGYIQSEWGIAESGPARRYYSLTEAGGEALVRAAERMVLLKERVERFLDAYAQQPVAHAPSSAEVKA